MGFIYVKMLDINMLHMQMLHMWNTLPCLSNNHIHMSKRVHPTVLDELGLFGHFLQLLWNPWRFKIWSKTSWLMRILKGSDAILGLGSQLASARARLGFPQEQSHVEDHSPTINPRGKILLTQIWDHGSLQCHIYNKRYLRPKKQS